MNYKKRLFIDGRTKTSGKDSNIKWDNPIDLKKWLEVQLDLLGIASSDGDWIRDANGIYNDTDNVSIGTKTPIANTLFLVDGGAKVDWSTGLQQTSLQVNNNGFIGSATQLDLSSFINLQTNTATVANKAIATHDSELLLNNVLSKLKHNNTVSGSDASIQLESNRIFSFLDTPASGDSYYDLIPGSIFMEANRSLPSSNGQFELAGGAKIELTAQTTPGGGTILIDAFPPTAGHATIKFDTGDGSGGVQEYADNATAVGAGLNPGDIYRTGDLLKIVH
jgi:hypothetical protein